MRGKVLNKGENPELVRVLDYVTEQLVLFQTGEHPAHLTDRPIKKTEIIEKTGLSKTVVNRLFNLKVYPTLETVLSICLAYNIPVCAFLPDDVVEGTETINRVNKKLMNEAVAKIDALEELLQEATEQLTEANLKIKLLEKLSTKGK